jgi:hypothetical protein
MTIVMIPATANNATVAAKNFVRNLLKSIEPPVFQAAVHGAPASGIADFCSLCAQYEASL